jgi:hypothetical protein
MAVKVLYDWAQANAKNLVKTLTKYYHKMDAYKNILFSYLIY